MSTTETSQTLAVPVAPYTTEFRAYNDDAWYTVCVFREGESLRVKFYNFPDEHDCVFGPSQFRNLEHFQNFQGRFRPLSKQLQDNECRQLVHGALVCACHSFSHDDVRFYDALVDAVGKSDHSWATGEELCSCTFILEWLHGPNARTLTVAKIEDICMVQSSVELDPAVVSFLEMTREKIEPLSSEYRCHDRRMEDRDLEGIKNMCMILMENMDKELCPSTVTEFLCRHTSISAEVFIFPSFPSEVYTRGAIILDSGKEFQKLCDFLNTCIITSSTGRPWVIIEKVVGLKNIKASIGTLVHVSKNIVHNGKSGRSNNLKIVRPGTKEFKIASELRDLFLAFSDHQKRLHKRLASEERRLMCS
ncbi:hypothetical protein RJT34_00085 [Clitoria ternatea]|uniref:SAWADEE domain-containing protein n=1 Tax=Clitoria ternatea TaxID=43366 RepID=A0AAN9KHS8_CLITE